MKIVKSLSFWLGMLLTISLIVNVAQYKIYHREPIVETIIHSDTITTVDTFYVQVVKDTFIYKPQPVMVDTVLDVRIYRDTVYHDYGWVSLMNTTQGSLLSQGIGMSFNVPQYYATRTITNTITNVVRNDIMLLHGGVDYSIDNKMLSPVVGATYVWNKHRRVISANYSFMDKRININAGFNLWR